MIKTKDEKILDLCVLGRDRLYTTLLQIEKTIKYVEENDLDDLKTFLYSKGKEVEEKIKDSTELINSLLEVENDNK